MSRLFKKIRIVAFLGLLVFALVSPLSSAARDPDDPNFGGKDPVVTTGAAAAEPKEEKSWYVRAWEYITGKSGDAVRGTVTLSVFADIIDYAAEISPFDNSFIQCSPQESCIGRAITNANRFILNLANLFYILVLLVIAIAQIFGIESYSVQRLLPRLVIAILLSTFGLYFVQLVANTAQLLADGLIPPNGLAAPLIEASGAGELLTQSITEKVLALIPIAGWFTLIIYELINPLNWFTLAFLVVAIILIFRIAGLWVLSIVAPVGIAFGVLPQTAGYAKLYWKKVLSYAFIAPILIFFLRLAILVYTAARAQGSNAFLDLENINAISPLNSKNYIGAALAIIIILFGIAVTRKLGVEVANFTIGAFQKAFKTAIGLGKAAAVAGGTFLTAGGSLATFLAARGVSEATQKNIGLLGKSLGSGLKSSGVGPLKSVGSLIEPASSKLFEKQEAPKYKPQLSGYAFARDIYKEKDKADGDTYRELAKSDPQQFFDEYISKPGISQNERLANAMFLMEAGKIGSEHLSETAADGTVTTSQLSFDEVGRALGESGARALATEARAYDMRIDPNIAAIDSGDPATRARGVTAVQKFVTANADKLHLQNAEVFKNVDIADYMQKLLSRDQWDLMVKRLAPKKQEALAQSLRVVARSQGERGNIREFEKINARADRLKSDPVYAYDEARFTGTAGGGAAEAALIRAAKALEKAAAKTPEVYANKSTEAATKLILKLDAPDKVPDIRKVVNAAIKQEFKRLARDEAASFSNADVPRALLGDMLSKVDKTT